MTAPTLTSALAAPFVWTSGGTDIALTFASGTSPVNVTIPTGTYRMVLAPSATDFVRVYVAAINAAIIAALFQDSTANALAARASYYGANAENNWLTLHYRMAAGTTSATTFKVRAGANANSLRFNGYSGSRVYGGACYSYLKVTEIFA